MSEKELELLIALLSSKLDNYKMSPYTRSALKQVFEDVLTKALLDQKEGTLNIGDTVQVIDCDSTSYDGFIGSKATVVDKYTVLRVITENDGVSLVMKPKYFKKIEEE